MNQVVLKAQIQRASASDPRLRGIAIEVVDGGAAALEAMQGRRYHLVMLDLMMPGIDGFQVLARLRERADPTPVAVVTAGSAELRARVPAEHVVAVLTKPVGIADLQALLQRTLA